MIGSSNFVFVHVPRTAGWSIVHALRPHTTLFAPHHAPATARQKWWVEDRWKFASVRNPWDRIVSLFHSKWNKQHEGLPFGDWWRTAYPELLQARPHIWSLSQRYWLDLPLDHYIRFEDVAAEWDLVRAKLNIEEPLPHLHKLERPHYRDVLPSIVVDEIAQACEWEIKKFGYRF